MAREFLGMCPVPNIGRPKAPFGALAPALVFGLALALAACGTPPPIISESPQPHSVLAFDVFSTGYAAIKEKYIDPVEIRKIAAEGMRGFASIDPALSVRVAEDGIHMSHGGTEVFRRAAPAGDDPTAWAAVTVDLATRARAYSREMNDASAEKLYEAVFDGALSELDVFSRYAGADEARRNRSQRDGFGGIGIRFKVEAGQVKITTVMAETPAKSAGVKTGDRITAIDGQAPGPSEDDITRQLQGPPESEVRIGLFRADEERSFELTITRQHIVPPTVSARLDDNVLYLRISNFNQGTADAVSEEVEKAKSNARPRLLGIVMDLRGNPGGLLKQSIKIADLMLTHGHILTTKGRHPDSLHHYEAGGRDIAGGIPIVVIIDGKSASASEIVAAALQDRDRAVVIGTSSFGKGSVQTVVRLPNDGEMTLTWSRFQAPSGYILHGLGVRPTICTSDVKRDLKPAIEAALADRLKLRATFASWRAGGAPDETRRHALRDTCPAARRKTYADVRIANYLAAHPALYAKALDIASATAEAQN